MPLVEIRELLSFPENGDNATDTVINYVHFNRTALEYFNYILYSNGTLSNGSNCWLSFGMYQPSMLSNGSFINATSCYFPVEGLEARGSAGIAFASMFAITIMFTLINLRKHGKRFLPLEKRWRVIGRRWQWYWMLFVAACGTISCFMGIDVDRNYLQGLALSLQSLFFYLLLPGLLAAVWEGVRHWGSWQERQICDRDTVAFSEASTREKQEFYLPLIFYLFGWLNFFMVIPRNWNSIPKQRSEDQTMSVAKPSATDGRFKAGSILAAVCLVIICYSLGHSVYRYKERPVNRSSLITFYLTSAPLKFIICIILTGLRVGFGVASTFSWDISPVKYDGNAGWLYGLGYAPALLVLVVLNIWGYIDPNEDKYLIEQRRERGRAADAELGIEAGKRKPAWWRRLHPDFQHVSGNDPNARLKALTTEIGGGRPTQKNLEHYIEMGTISTGTRDQSGHTYDVESPSKIIPNDPIADSVSRINTSIPLNPTGQKMRPPSRSGSQATLSSGETLHQTQPPQKVRSMLDV
ncbi:hypothetical protein, variant [Blastomyces dermatitidis ER-3]|uniref:Uncharacterized protein n=2 Tax=Ajellomyces dermatitidis TaxID=5039 RepID=F2TM76_AJEDA|nr:uncharacterized protein BDCG_08989 [Blastomyces dermatitidis ER-3]XP_045282781.1 hypothetical protein, variant [Blastomyces dermatitidis ER-3]EGE84339.1 hypothetical protein BDDG_07284 [Blastomyces dermatitidis ATCC 18188]EQL27931.1 hypothetical protein BDFG_09268 [Blastomyces dermatitidis ATCC 26199]EEQ85720.1 hypothetical protein BDCG_08989 [Blastomyces dermatitidis ER-3]EQL27932.1 hypothetical protein, variant [Blastomyces dermatitidis ATCC 26199]KMW68332.1 hypothetical protein, variant